MPEDNKRNGHKLQQKEQHFLGDLIGFTSYYQLVSVFKLFYNVCSSFFIIPMAINKYKQLRLLK